MIRRATYRSGRKYDPSVEYEKEAFLLSLLRYFVDELLPRLPAGCTSFLSCGSLLAHERLGSTAEWTLGGSPCILAWDDDVDVTVAVPAASTAIGVAKSFLSATRDAALASGLSRS